MGQVTIFNQRVEFTKNIKFDPNSKNMRSLAKQIFGEDTFR